MFLFVDCETGPYRRGTGGFTSYPRLVQLAWSLFSPEGEQIASANDIVVPEFFEIPKELTDIHGITTERAMKNGTPLHRVLKAIREPIEKSTIIVAHNATFDRGVISGEFQRTYQGDPLAGKVICCTMQSTREFVGIRNVGRGGFKQPSLAELHRRLFGCDVEKAHDAGHDTETVVKCFFELKNRGFAFKLKEAAFK